MAIEIVTRGVAPSERSYTSTCTVCSTCFRYKRSDAKEMPGDYRESPYLSIACPVCQRTCMKNINNYDRPIPSCYGSDSKT